MVLLPLPQPSPRQQGTLETLSRSLTLLRDAEGDQPRGLHKGPVRLKLKLPGHVTGVEAGVIERDVEHSDGHILQVLTPVPLQAPLEGALHLLVAVSVFVDLQVEKQEEDRAQEETERGSKMGPG